MATATARRRNRRARLIEDRGAGPSQPPWRLVESRQAPMALLAEDELERLHDMSMRILEECGIEVASARARALFARAGAIVDEETQIVRIGRDAIMAAIATAPATFTLTPVNPERALTIGGNAINFGLVSGPPNVHDCINGRRPASLADYRKLVALGQHFNVVHFLGNQTVAPMDLPANTRHLDTYRANLELTDKVFGAVSIGAGRTRDAVEMLAIARGKSLDELVAEPATFTNININSPRRLDVEMADGAMQMAALGQAVIVTPFTLMGAMTPVTLAAALTQQNAEALFGIALTQLVRPGAPAVYGAFTSNVDLRTGAPAFGTPENGKANIVGGQLARYYGLPYRTSACNASNCVDAQAVYETETALWGAVLGHGNCIYHAAGWLEGGLVASFEKLVVDVEMLQTMVELLQPIDLSADAFALEAIATTPPGGHFFGATHTLARYEHAFYQPLASDWQNSENWRQAGARTATQRATAIWQAALDTFEPPVLPEDRREAVDAFVARRKTAIGGGEPTAPIHFPAS